MIQTLYLAPIAVAVTLIILGVVMKKITKVCVSHSNDHFEFQDVKSDIQAVKTEGHNRKEENTLIIEGINYLMKRSIELGSNGKGAEIQTKFESYLDEVMENRT